MAKRLATISVGASADPATCPVDVTTESGCRALTRLVPQLTGTMSAAPSRAPSAVSSSGIVWLSRSAATRAR